MSNYFYLSILTKWVLLKDKVGKKKQINMTNIDKKLLRPIHNLLLKKNWTSLLIVERRCVKNLKYGNTQKFYQVSWKSQDLLSQTSASMFHAIYSVKRKLVPNWKYNILPSRDEWCLRILPSPLLKVFYRQQMGFFQLFLDANGWKPQQPT